MVGMMNIFNPTGVPKHMVMKDWGQQDVEKLLHEALRDVQAEGFGAAAVAMIKKDGKGFYQWSGAADLLSGLSEVMDQARWTLIEIDNDGIMPARRKLGPSFHCYDCLKMPMGFDFVGWLVSAEQYRIVHGGPPPLKVGFWLGKDMLLLRGSESRFLSWVDNVFRPALQLIGAVEDPEAIYGRLDPTGYGMKHLMEAHDRGLTIPILSAGMDYQSGNKTVSITLRETTMFPYRNSNVHAWMQFADWLISKGYEPLFIRDTAHAEEALGHFTTSPLASRNLIKRAQIYETSYANLFVGNGPWSLALYMKRPWLQWLWREEAEKLDPTIRPNFWAEFHGIQMGNQFPWGQGRILWDTPDTLPNLIKGWQESGL